ncbi:DUF4157 domain-containing protein [Psychromonas sp.]|uniref:eCIS core domain-containing protein n=1 Tax=Psychromonas sp. TaxID=1884585 RepID=UPI0039E25990
MQNMQQRVTARHTTGKKNKTVSVSHATAVQDILQPKLKIGPADDKYEQEADRVAEQVIRMTEPKEKNTTQGNANTDRTTSSLLAGSAENSIQRQEESKQKDARGVRIQLKANNLPRRQQETDFDEDEEDRIQAKGTPGHTSQVTPNVAANIQNLRGGGQPLPTNQRRFFESRMGQDFSGVRIHTGSKATDTAQAIQAKAFTMGNNIVFNTGQYSHNNQEGKKLLAHELTHVVQQRATDAPPPSTIARTPDDDFDSDVHADRLKKKEKDKRITKLRQRGNTKSLRRAAREAAATIDRMIGDAESGGHQSASLKSKQQLTNKFRRQLDLYRFDELTDIDERMGRTAKGDRERKRLVARKRAIVLERTNKQFTFDEALRTPRRRGVSVQQTYVSGGPAAPQHEIVERRGGFARPDFSDTTRSAGESARLHVNLKSNDIRHIGMAGARKIAKQARVQAIKNMYGDPKKRGRIGHLLVNEPVVISFNDRPRDRAVQAEMVRIMFADDDSIKGARPRSSPIAQIRFAETTVSRPVASGNNLGSPGSSTPGRPQAQGKRARISNAKFPAGERPPARSVSGEIESISQVSGRSSASENSLGSRGSSTPGSPKAQGKRARMSNAKWPASAGPPARVANGAIGGSSSPGGGKLRRSGKPGPRLGSVTHSGEAAPSTTGTGGRRVSAAVAADIVAIVAVPIINHFLEEYHSERKAEGFSKLTEQALAKANPRYLAAIEANSSSIEAAQAQGRRVRLHVVVETGSVTHVDNDPIAGSGLSSGEWSYVANVKDVQVVFEGDKPKSYDPNTNWAGDAFRFLVDVRLHYSYRDYPIEGTDEEVRRRNKVIKGVEAALGESQVEFEELVVKSRQGDFSKEYLREYVMHKIESTGALPRGRAGRGPEVAKYWRRMEALIDGPIDEVIAQAKVKSVPLDKLRAHAVSMGESEFQSKDNWSNVGGLIDAPLEDHLAADRQRFLWTQPASKKEVSEQRAIIDVLEINLAPLQKRLAEASRSVYRNNNEPAQPDWAAKRQIEREIKSIRESIRIEKKLLKDLEKPPFRRP